MDNIFIKLLETKLKGFLKNEYRIDSKYRFCLLYSQLGDLFHYLTHDPFFNPKARSWGSKEDEKGACAQALMQFLMTIVIVDLPVAEVFYKAFSNLHKMSKVSIEDVEKNIPLNKNFSNISIDLILKISKFTSKLESNNHSINNAAILLKTIAIYIKVRGFSFKEVLLMGIKNQEDRDWAKTVVEESNNGKLFGVIGVPGMITGKAYVVSEKNPLSDFPKGNILVTNYTKAEFIKEIKRAIGVITNNGGKTSHAALICIEEEIPCLVGTGCATEKIKHGQEIMLCAFDENDSNVGQGYVQLL